MIIKWLYNDYKKKTFSGVNLCVELRILQIYFDGVAAAEFLQA